MKKVKTIPFDFVLEALESMHPRVNPMFGCHAIYIGEKIMLIVRLKQPEDPDNGIWVARSPEDNQSLNESVYKAFRKLHYSPIKESHEPYFFDQHCVVYYRIGGFCSAATGRSDDQAGHDSSCETGPRLI